MGKEFRTEDEAVVPATPEEIWAAIATGPGIDSWYLGRSKVDADTVTTDYGGFDMTSPITAFAPGERLAYGTQANPGDRFLAYEFLIEGRDRSSTVLRLVANGFLPGDDWAEEFEAMSKGGQLYWHSLVTYVTHFAGRTATPLETAGPRPASWDDAWLGIGRALGLDRRPSTGDAVRLEIAPGEVVDGTVYFANDQTAGVRTAGAMYRFLQGFRGPMLCFHEIFDGPVDHDHWTGWLRRAYAARSGEDRP
jgi:uncharacterized protein YndB with AHSA1/START domain